MRKKVENFIEEQGMLQQGSCVVVAVSGGADSVCLLHLLVSLREKMGLKLLAVHVHHGLRGEEANRDAQFVRELSEAWKVPCLVVYRDVTGYARKKGLSVEEAGRELRYQAFREAAEQMEDGRIAIAHHQDDQAETILHNLFRGSGIKGLGGMLAVRGTIIRPLLCVSRSEIVEYLKEEQITYCVDSTNASVDYTRNKLRHKVIPMICQEVNTAAIQHIVAAGERLHAAEEYFNQEAKRLWKEHKKIVQTQAEMVPIRQGIQAELMIGLPDILKGYLAMEMIKEMTGSCKDITSKHVAQILDIAKKGTGRSSCLPYGIKVYKEYDIVWMEKLEDIREPKEKKENSQEIYLDILPECLTTSDFNGSVHRLPSVFTAKCYSAAFLREKYHKIPENKYTKWFDYDKIKGTLSVRTRKTGDYFILKDGSRKTIKSFMIDEKIPRQERDKILLLAQGQHILWVIGYRISEFYKITEETKQILQVRMDGGEEHGG